MVNNLASDIAAHSPIEGEDHMIKVDGKSAAACKPCDLMVQTGAGTWTKAISTTAAHTLQKCGIVGYRERILSTGAQSTIDDEYSIGDIFPVILGFKMGTGRVIVAITDPVATVYPNHYWNLGAVAGEAEQANTADLAAGIARLDMVNVETIVSGDDYALMEVW